MEFLYEALVMGYLTTGGQRFCCPQYAIKTEKGEGDWRCPDLVILDFKEKQVIVAEVTAAYDMRRFAAKTKRLYTEGLPRLKQQLTQALGSECPKLVEWPIVIRAFVREDRKDDLNRLLEGYIPDFGVVTLEEALQRWKPDFGK